MEEFAKTPPPPINLTLSAEMDGWDGDQCHQITNLSKMCLFDENNLTDTLSSSECLKYLVQ